MASEDVIELGSSDDEAEPAPKKKKPTPNAMVHFPNKIPGLTIKPVKSVNTLHKALAGGAITIKNVNPPKVVPQVNKARINGKFIQNMPQRIHVAKPIHMMEVQSSYSINPLSLTRNSNNAHMVKSPRVTLPPGITVKRAPGASRNLPLAAVTKKRRHIKQKMCTDMIPTVELDDEEVSVMSTSNDSPQWYIRPEDQEELSKAEEAKDEPKHDMETENNTEPDTSKFIEITIDDSPVKPVSTKRTQEVNSELAITIDDSPVKAVKQASRALGSDSEEQSSVLPHSKKRLDYPREEDQEMTDITKTTTIEVAVEFERPGCSNETMSNTLENDDPNVEKQGKGDAQEVIASKEPLTKDVEATSKQSASASESSEFHPVYQQFIDVCFQFENSDDMKKIVDKKVKTYYKQCPKEYVESEEFIDMVSSKIFAMKAGPEKLYLYIKDIVDELNLQRKTAKAVEVAFTEMKNTEGEKFYASEKTGYDSKLQRQIRKLEKTLKKLHRAIQKLEEQEVEFEDEEDSVYLLTERYKERLVQVHAKLCQLTNTKMPSEPRIQIEARPGQPPGPAKRLEKWINKKVPIGTPLPFPDFHDVLRCVRDANDDDRLGWNEAAIMEEARDLFVRCGKKLQRRRQENEWRNATSRISHNVSTIDPAEQSDALRKRLEENKKVASKKESEVLNKYADKQNQLKLVGEEIGDKEADESPMESEEDEVVDNSNSLEDKQKRKERLKRLLTEKTRKSSTENETTSIYASKDIKDVNELNEKEAEHVDEVGILEEKGHDKKDEPDVNNETESKKVDTETSKNEEVFANHNRDNSDNNDGLVESDVDELHLLQKLYSENEMNSSVHESSDSGSPICISDTMSDSEIECVKKQQEDDVISIENSSYSESEMKSESSKEHEFDYNKTKIDKIPLLTIAEEPTVKEELSKPIEIDENILLASSDEENTSMDVDGKDSMNQNKICEIQLSNQDSISKMSNEVHTDHVRDDMTRSTEIPNLEKNGDKIEFSETLSDDVMIENEAGQTSQKPESLNSEDINNQNDPVENKTPCDDTMFKNDKDSSITSSTITNETGNEKDGPISDSISDEVMLEKEDDTSVKSTSKKDFNSENQLTCKNNILLQDISHDNNKHNVERNDALQGSDSKDDNESTSNNGQIFSNRDTAEEGILKDNNTEKASINTSETLSSQENTNTESAKSSTVETANHKLGKSNDNESDKTTF